MPIIRARAKMIKESIILLVVKIKVTNPKTIYIGPYGEYYTSC